METAPKIARQRLSALELAKTLGYVSEARRQRRMARSQLYEYKRRFQTHGLEGRQVLRPIPKEHSPTTPPTTVARSAALSLQQEGISVASLTIQSILIKHDMGIKYDWVLNLQDQATRQAIELTPERIVPFEWQNPALRERHVESGRSGELPCQDPCFVGRFKRVGKLHLHGVVDAYGSYAYGVLHNDALPSYPERGLTVDTVLTDIGREFCGTDAHPYKLYLAHNDVAHRTTKVRRPRTNGLVERFN